MKKLIFLAFLASMTQSVFAECSYSSLVFLNDKDNMGVNLDLTYSCYSGATEICVYHDENIAGITGTDYSSMELFRRKITSTHDSLKISLKSAFLDSLQVHKYIELEINKRNLRGVVKYGARGFDPFGGVIVGPPKMLLLDCKQER